MPRIFSMWILPGLAWRAGPLAQARDQIARSAGCGVKVASVLLLFMTMAFAQNSLLKNAELCNGENRAQSDQAIAACTAIINSQATTSHGSAIAYNNRANALAGKGQYAAAIKDYDQSIKLDPKYAIALNNRGVAYHNIGEYDRAIADFDGAIQLSADYASAFVNRALAYEKKADYSRALNDFDEAIRLRPKVGGLWNERCWIRAVTGAAQAALDDCNEALNLGPKTAAKFDSRGLAYLKLGQWEQAIGDYDFRTAAGPETGKFALRTRISPNGRWAI